MMERAAKLLALFRAQGKKIVTAESCTGGLLAARLTDIPGASDVFERGWITYSNTAKHEELGVASTLIEQFGAVSAEVAYAMAEGALTHSRADVGLAITGIAGPGGGSAEKPVGLVFIACAKRNGRVSVDRHLLAGDRSKIRESAVEQALIALEKAIHSL